MVCPRDGWTVIPDEDRRGRDLAADVGKAAAIITTVFRHGTGNHTDPSAQGRTAAGAFQRPHG